jgi:hypothetical protein
VVVAAQTPNLRARRALMSTPTEAAPLLTALRQTTTEAVALLEAQFPGYAVPNSDVAEPACALGANALTMRRAGAGMGLNKASPEQVLAAANRR